MTAVMPAIMTAIVPMTTAVVPAGIPVTRAVIRPVVIRFRVVVIAAGDGVIPPVVAAPVVVIPVPAVPSPVVPTAPDIGEAVTHIAVITVDSHEDPDPVTVMRHGGGSEPEQKHSNQSGAQHVKTLITSANISDGQNHSAGVLNRC
jgi:hypothetical protein